MSLSTATNERFIFLYQLQQTKERFILYYAIYLHEFLNCWHYLMAIEQSDSQIEITKKFETY